MENSVREGGAAKRPLDEDDGGGDDKKKLKTGPDLQQFSPTTGHFKNVNNVKNWNLLPSIVYELLLVLFKKSDEDKQDKIDNDSKEDFKVSSNQNCQEKCLDNAFKHEHLKVVDRCDKIIIDHSILQNSSNSKDFVLNLDELDSSKKITEDIPKKVPLITKASPVKLFPENTDVDKTEQAEDESNEKSNVVKKQLTPIHNVCHLSMFHCTNSSTNDISKTVVITDNDYNAATSANSIYNTPMLTSDISNTSILIPTNSISNTAKFSSTNNNTLSVSESSAHKDVIPRTENIFRVQMFEFLNKNCRNGISEISLTKPSPCNCNCCTVVSSLPKNQSAAYNLFFTSSNNLSCTNFHCDINSSNKLCELEKPLIYTDSPKNIWINQLTSLINKKENTSKICLTTITNDSKKLNPMKKIMNQVHETTQHIKSHSSFCNKCKKSKYSRSNSCKCYNRSYKYDTYNN